MMLQTTRRKTRDQQLPFPGSAQAMVFEDVIWSAFQKLPPPCQSLLLDYWESGANRPNLSTRKNTSRQNTIEYCLAAFLENIKASEGYTLLKCILQPA